MLLDDTPRDVQAQTHAREVPVVDVAGSEKALEHQRLIVAGDAYTAVANA
jgi:hypothetical protein